MNQEFLEQISGGKGCLIALLLSILFWVIIGGLCFFSL